MRMDKLTSKFQLALADAQSLALGRDHQFIEPVHLMVALLDQEGGSVRPLLGQADVNVNQLRSSLSEALERLASVQGNAGGAAMRLKHLIQIEAKGFDPEREHEIGAILSYSKCDVDAFLAHVKQTRKD